MTAILCSEHKGLKSESETSLLVYAKICIHKTMHICGNVLYFKKSKNLKFTILCLNFQPFHPRVGFKFPKSLLSLKQK